MDAPEEVAALAQAQAGKLGNVVGTVLQLLGELDAAHHREGLAGRSARKAQPVHVAALVRADTHLGIARSIGAVRALVVVVHVQADVRGRLAEKRADRARIADFIVISAVHVHGLGGNVAAPGGEARLAVLHEPATHRGHVDGLLLPVVGGGAAVIQVHVQHVVIGVTGFHLAGIGREVQVKILRVSGDLHGLEGGIVGGGVLDGNLGPVDTEDGGEGAGAGACGGGNLGGIELIRFLLLAG